LYRIEQYGTIFYNSATNNIQNRGMIQWQK
jgi:hypothetical protein